MSDKPKELLLGVNLTARSQIADIKKLINSGVANYVEILIDNFLSCDPLSIRESLSEIPIAFHIMNSRFLERDTVELGKIAARFRRFIDTLKPLYVSDHLARFTVDGLPLPIIVEIDYPNYLNTAVERILLWQDLLGTQLFLENFPSDIGESAAIQPDFFQKLMEKTNCGVLFDVSNAVLGWKNKRVALEAWQPVFESASHFHAGGFSQLHDSPIYIDSHAQSLNEETKHWIQKILAEKSKSRTLTIEFDHDINYEQWEKDLVEVRNTIGSLAQAA